MAVWVKKLQAEIAKNPLYFSENYKVRCAKCGGAEKKVPLYKITNYNEFRTCDTCKLCYR